MGIRVQSTFFLRQCGGEQGLTVILLCSIVEPNLRGLQNALIDNPLAGDSESGTGGLRKVRMPDSSRNKGKRSGARVHYLFLPAHDVIYLVFVYGKDEQTKPTTPQKKQLKAVAERIRAEWE